MKENAQIKVSPNRCALTLLAFIVIVCILFVGCGKKEEPAPKTPTEETPAGADGAKLGDKAALLEGLTFVKGKPVTIEEGKIYVVEFWATWCGPCRTSIPHLTKVQKEFKDQGVTVIGISGESEIDEVKSFVAEQGEKMDYTVAVDPDSKVNNGYMKAYRQRGIPSAFIVDQKSNVVWVGHPMGALDQVLEEVVTGTFDLASHIKAKAEKEAADLALEKLFKEYFTALSGGTSIEKTRPIAEKIIKSSDPMALNRLAWDIMTLKDVDDAKRDFETALKAASNANTNTNGEDPSILDTYALALSKNGKLEEAIATQQKAVDLAADNERFQNNLRAQLEKFQESLDTTLEVSMP